MPGEVLAGARVVLVTAAVACIWRALQELRRDRRGGPRGLASRLVARLVDLVAAPAAGFAPLRRRSADPAVRSAIALCQDDRICRMVAAGARPDEEAVVRAAGVRALALASGAAAAAAALALLGGGGLPVALAALVGAAIAPDLLLTAAARAGRRRLLVALPPALDLLALCLDAGASVERALAVAARRAPAPVDAVLGRATALTAMGVPVGAALRREAERCGVAAMTALAGTVDRGRSLGTPLAPPLRVLADTLRAEARTALIERAARVGPLASVLTAAVIAPSCVVALVTLVVGGTLARSALG